MNEQENQSPVPPRPTIKTSAVPLKKETVRITLRPQSPEAPEAPAPPPPASASSPIPSAPAAPAPPAPRPVAPTVPLAPPPRPTVPGAPPPPGGRPGPPSGPVGSKTIPLSQPPARPTSPMVGKQTTKIGGATPTQALPRATVKLQPTAAPSASAPISSVNIRTAAIEDDDEIDEGPLNIMGWIALVGSIAAVVGVLSCMDKGWFGDFFSQGVVEATPATRDKAIEEWRVAAAPDGFKLPRDFSPYDQKDGNGGIRSEYSHWEPEVPSKPPAP